MCNFFNFSLPLISSMHASIDSMVQQSFETGLCWREEQEPHRLLEILADNAASPSYVLLSFRNRRAQLGQSRISAALVSQNYPASGASMAVVRSAHPAG